MSRSYFPRAAAEPCIATTVLWWYWYEEIKITLEKNQNHRETFSKGSFWEQLREETCLPLNKEQRPGELELDIIATPLRKVVQLVCSEAGKKHAKA